MQKSQQPSTESMGESDERKSSNLPRKYLVRTLGCKANLYDSQLIESALQRKGWVAASDLSEPGIELCIVNSCTVTDEADRQSRKLASRLGRENPQAKIVMTGCSAEVAPEQLARSKGVHYVVGNRDKPNLVNMVIDRLAQETGGVGQRLAGEVLGVAQGYGEMLSRHPIDREWPLTESRFASGESGLALEGGSHRTRAFLKIQDGCNSFCTYCVIPYGRGPNRSLSISDVVGQVRSLVSQGIQEVVITGINIGDYGTDWSDRVELDALFDAILKDTDLPRLRVSSLDPTEITPGMLKLVESNPRFCPHFHVSLQSPHSKVLRLMKRKYEFDQVRDCLTRLGELASPAGGVFVGMDVITGFPGETEEYFEWGVDALQKLYWSRLHVFPYSERAGTPATRLPGSIPPAERARRARVLRELSLERLKSVYQKAAATLRESGRAIPGVLLESSVRGPDGSQRWLSGYSLNYLRVLYRAPAEVDPASLENQVREDLQAGELLVDAEAGDVALLARSV